MISTPAKVVCGFCTAGAVGTGSYFVITNISKPDKPQPKTKLSEQLIKDGFTLLNFESGNVNQTEWTNVLGKYKASSKDKFVGVNLLESGQDHEVKNIDAVKAACKALVETTDFSESYGKARRWCVVPKKVQDILSGLNKVILDNSSPSQNHNDKWKIKASSYDHKVLPLSGIVWPQTGEDNQISKLKEGCKTLLAKDVKTYDDAFSVDYKTAERWCIE